MVLSIFVESTTPSRTLRAFGRGVVSVVSAIGLLLLQLFVRRDLALAQDRVEPGDVLLHLADAGGVLLLPGCELEAQGEQRLLVLCDLVHELVVAQVAQRCALLGHQTSASTAARVTNLALIGSFW